MASLRQVLPTLALSLLAWVPWMPVMAGDAVAVAIIPAPAHVEAREGAYRPDGHIRIGLRGDAPELQDLAALARELLAARWSQPITMQAHDAPGAADLVLALEPDAAGGAEAYRLRVDASGIRVQASAPVGLFHGLQTLRQLLAQLDGSGGLPYVDIEDAPRFAWRGLHLDVARHMFPLDHIKRQIDLMARYKFNVLHWHLTDDQGWRLEIRRHPRLTAVGGWRSQTGVMQKDGSIRYDGTRYGGHYTQDEAREIVEYARQRHITVVPEIEMPGHTVAILAAYPQLACTPGPFEVRVDWGIDDNVLCPSEATFAFIEDVLDEVLAIFPSTYIHVGGDEAPIVRWQESALAQDIIRREGLRDEHALQGWFMRRIERYLRQHGRRMLAWDEMLAGDPAQSTTIMAWRSLDEGAKAARRGHDVVMTPTSYSYFDYCQSRSPDEPPCPGYLPMRQVYAFEPVPAGLTAGQARHVLGGQANLWTEHIRTPAAAEYMLWPRALAMAEVLWSPAASRDWPGFLRRLPSQLRELGQLGVGYRVPEVDGLDGDVLTLEADAVVGLQAPLADARIVYTLDGGTPTADSPTYFEPLRLALGDAPVIVTARLLTADGRLGPAMRAQYARTTLRPAQPVDKAALRAGLVRDYFEGAFTGTGVLASAMPLRSDTTAVIGIPEGARAEGFALRHRGFIEVPADGVYRFALRSDDGARLWIDGELLIDRDGPQSPGTSHGSVGLAAGLHALELRYFQGGGDKVLDLEVSRDGQPAAAVPGAWWWH